MTTICFIKCSARNKDLSFSSQIAARLHTMVLMIYISIYACLFLYLRFNKLPLIITSPSFGLPKSPQLMLGAVSPLHIHPGGEYR